MPSPQSKAFWVGSFVVVGTALAIVALIYFGISNWFRKTAHYVTYYDTSVQGLILDAAVKFRGVDVGRVANIRVAPDGQLVEVELELDPEFIVTDSLRTSLALAGITGMKYIEMNYPAEELLDDHPSFSFETPFRVIHSQPGSFEAIETALRDVYAKIMVIDTEGISHKTKDFLDTGTRVLDNIDSIMTRPELTQWSIKLNDNLVLMEELLLTLDAADYAQEIDTTLAELREGVHHFNLTLQILENDIAQLRVSDKADSLFTQMDLLLSNSAQLVNQSQYSSSRIILQLAQTVNEMNATLEQLNSLMMSLEAYPSHIINTEPPPKEK